MILKDAYRYQNFLDGLISSASYYLMSNDFITTTTETHNRKKVNDQAEDEVVVAPKRNSAEFTPMQLVDFTVKVVDEKQRLTDAISDAKRKTEIDIDSAVAMNKVKQKFSTILSSMARTKSSESHSTGRDYKFDVNGEQKPYNYTIDSVTTIDFDRNDIRALIKKYSKETDAISAKLDQIQIGTEIDFEPTWDLTDSLEDILAGETAS